MLNVRVWLLERSSVPQTVKWVLVFSQPNTFILWTAEKVQTNYPAYSTCRDIYHPGSVLKHTSKTSVKVGHRAPNTHRYLWGINSIIGSAPVMTTQFRRRQPCLRRRTNWWPWWGIDSGRCQGVGFAIVTEVRVQDAPTIFSLTSHRRLRPPPLSIWRPTCLLPFVQRKG